jgi:hypothetical protein
MISSRTNKIGMRRLLLNNDDIIFHNEHFGGEIARHIFLSFYSATHSQIIQFRVYGILYGIAMKENMVVKAHRQVVMRRRVHQNPMPFDIVFGGSLHCLHLLKKG